MKSHEIITDAQIDEAWGNADFGTSARRDVINGGIMKVVGGYSNGFTLRQILNELGLVTLEKYTGKAELTSLGRLFVFALYEDQRWYWDTQTARELSLISTIENLIDDNTQLRDHIRGTTQLINNALHGHE